MKKHFAIMAIAAIASIALPAQAKDTFRVAWSHYAGWEPWGYAADSGIIAKHAKAEGIKIDVTLVNDYLESVNLFTGGTYDACAMTNMDALTSPAAGGVDTEVLIVGDYSNGNDGIVAKGANTVADLKGRTINLVELSVSHYLLARALTMSQLSEKDVRLVNTSDADIAAVFIQDPKGVAVTWNPPLMEARKAAGAKVVFDSSQIPFEILDLMVVNAKADPRLKRALVGAWYEVLGLLKKEDKQALEWMAASAGTDVEGYKAQLKTTAMFWTPGEAAAFVKSVRPKNVMAHVRGFAFANNLFGDKVTSPDFVGIEFDDKTVLGSTRNVKLRFTSAHMSAAASAAK